MNKTFDCGYIKSKFVEFQNPLNKTLEYGCICWVAKSLDDHETITFCKCIHYTFIYGLYNLQIYSVSKIIGLNKTMMMFLFVFSVVSH